MVVRIFLFVIKICPVFHIILVFVEVIVIVIILSIVGYFVFRSPVIVEKSAR